MASEPVTIRESRGWIVVYLVGSLVFSTLFSWFLYGDWVDGVTAGTLLASACVAGFWIATGAFIYRFARPLDLLVSEDGFRLTNWRKPTSWSDVEGFSITFQHYDFWSRKMIYRDHAPGVRLVTWRLKPTASRSSLFEVGRAIGGVDGVLPHTLKMDAGTLLAFLEQQRRRPARVSLEESP